MIYRTTTTRPSAWIGHASAMLVLLACGGDDMTGGEEQAASGNYYVGEASAALGGTNNGADCATCHSDDGTQEGFSGKTFKDIAYRESYKGGDADSLLAGTNACVVGWMGGEALLDGDPAWLALEEFLQSISSSDVSAANEVAPQVLADEAAYEAEYTGGDAEAGEAKYGLYCGTCHDGALVVGSAPAWALSGLATRSVGRIAQKVRTSGPPPSGTEDDSDSTPGPMPFFEPSDLPADDLRDIIAFVTTSN